MLQLRPLPAEVQFLLYWAEQMSTMLAMNDEPPPFRVVPADAGTAPTAPTETIAATTAASFAVLMLCFLAVMLVFTMRTVRTASFVPVAER